MKTIGYILALLFIIPNYSQAQKQKGIFGDEN